MRVGALLPLPWTRPRHILSHSSQLLLVPWLHSPMLSTLSHKSGLMNWNHRHHLVRSCNYRSTKHICCLFDKTFDKSESSSEAGGYGRYFGEVEGTGERRVGVFPDIHAEEYERQIVRELKVAVFWDLDNKPPNTVPPYEAALQLKRVAREFGDVVAMVAYANHNAFTHIPQRVREERQDRKALDHLEKTGIIRVLKPYLCAMCGRKFKTNVDLKKHFKLLHERERNKRMTYLSHLKGKKKSRYLNKVAEKEFKYKEAARKVITPKVGYGLASELKRAGVTVKTVQKKPQAADEALLKQMTLYLNEGIECIFLVSDDSDFLGILRTAKRKRVCTVVIGDTPILRRAADSSFSWGDVESGMAMRTAFASFQRWANEDALRTEVVSTDEFDDAHFSASDDEEFLEFQKTVRSSVKLSAFADDEEDYDSDNDEDEDEDEELEGYPVWDLEAVDAESTL